MNYNPNSSVRNLQGGPGRKVKRVSDVNAVGPSAPAPPAPFMQPGPGGLSVMDPIGGPTYGVSQSNPFNNGSIPVNQNFGYLPQGQPQHQQQQPQQQQQQQIAFPSQQPQNPYGTQFQSSQHGVGVGIGGPNENFGVSNASQFPGSTLPPQLSMFQEPIVQDMAMQYGQKLADQGKQLMENQFEKYVPVAKLKYYFAVDNNYVINKLRLLFFPFVHKDWSLKYDQENPVQPRYDINAPDLYIPTMAYITYVVCAGLMLGMQKRFSPEQLGIQASSALAYCLFELVIYSIILYIVNIKTNLKTLDLLAFSGYKFVIIVACLLSSTVFYGFGYYLTFLYCSLALGFFLLRTLKTKVLQDNTPASMSGGINYDPYGNPQTLDYTGGRKRKLYFLFLIVGGQAFLSFLLSKHLYLRDAHKIDGKGVAS